MSRVDATVARMVIADQERHAQRNRQAAINLAAFALEQDDPEGWLLSLLQPLGLDQELRS